MKSIIALCLGNAMIIVALTVGATAVSGPSGDIVAPSEARDLNGRACYNSRVGQICADNCGRSPVMKGTPVTTGNSATWEIPPRCRNVDGCTQGYYDVGSSGCAGG